MCRSLSPLRHETELDENFGRRCVDVLTDTGHDVATVTGQQMSGAADEDVIQVCHSESRCLVSLDLDFANPVRFRPAEYSGIVVIRLSGRAGYSELLTAVNTFAKALETEPIAGNFGLSKSDASDTLNQTDPLPPLAS